MILILNFSTAFRNNIESRQEVVMVYFNIPYISIETRFLKTYFNNILPQICYLLYKISLSPQFSSCGYWNSIYCFYNAQCNLYAHSKI